MVSVFSGKVDLGTGVYTALTQIAAEELSVSTGKINLVQGDTLLTPDQGPAYGSLSIQIGGMQLRQAAATAREALIECAAMAGIDPLEYRVRNLKDKRGLELLERLAFLSRWEPRSGPRSVKGDIATGRGVSYVKYELVRTYVGVIADVTVNKKTGKIKVDRFYVAHDCGQIINPDGLENQIEGNVVQTVSRTLIEELQFNRSTVLSRDWETYPILTFPDAPQVFIALIDRPNEKPWGAGEPTAAVVPSAISNAVYDAVGIRLRSVPFAPNKVLAALKSA